MSLSAGVDLLACPRCGGRLALLGADGVRCERGHAFDVARQGYLNLLGRPQPRNADTAAMVAARHRFLSAGHYQPVLDSLAGVTATLPEDATVLDAGTGTGYYAAAALNAVPGSQGVGMDVSVAACRRAATAHPRLAVVVTDVWRALPAVSRGFDLVLSVFAPRNGSEFSRVLRDRGRLVVVHPRAGHLAELREPLGLLSVEDAKADRLAEALAPWFRVQATADLRFGLALDSDALLDLVGMGPNAFHTDEATLGRRVAELASPLQVTAEVSLSVWARR